MRPYRPSSPRAMLFRLYRAAFKSSPRLFTARSALCGSRVQLPFLATPNALSSRPARRLLSTESKRWLKDELTRGFKYALFGYAGLGLIVILGFGVSQEIWERRWPTPHEWSWNTRRLFRRAMWRADPAELPQSRMDQWMELATDWETWLRPGHQRHGVWLMIAEDWAAVIENLEDDIQREQQGLATGDRGHAEYLVEDGGRTGFDVSEKSEPWRRGYFQALMTCAQAAEKLDGWIKVIGTSLAFPSEVVVGPSNRDPQPVPPRSPPPPREHEVEQAFPGPAKFYLKAMTTTGFTDWQKLEAAIAYGVWLDHTGAPEAAVEMHDWALDLATRTLPEGTLDRETLVLNPDAGPPSSNLLVAMTSIATLEASKGNAARALPILVSLLRARKALPAEIPRRDEVVRERPAGLVQKLWAVARQLLISPGYPEAPPDGTEVPVRDAQERCEEAALMANIGEIIFAEAQGSKGHEDAIAWTREAIDIAMDELRAARSDGSSAGPTCMQCLRLGLENWKAMLHEIRHLNQKREQAEQQKWFPNQNEIQQSLNRWDREVLVWHETLRRAADVVKQNRLLST